MPSRWIGRDSGAMNVYSIVPSHRSQATVSVITSKMIPRYAQITPPIRSTVVSRLTSTPGPCCLHALRDEHDRERVRDGPEEERQLPPGVALDEVPVPLDDAAEPDQLAPQRRARCALHHANTSRSSSSSVSNAAPVAARNASSSEEAPYRASSFSTGSRQTSSPRSRMPTRSARLSASAMACVQRRIVASCSW